MTIKNFLFLIFIFTSMTLAGQNPGINLVSSNKSNYKIIISDTASFYDSLAAAEFQHYIEKAAHAQIPIFKDSSPVSDKEVIIGLNNRCNDIDISSITNDGFIIRTDKNKIYLIGKRTKGTLNAVYTFLEKYLDCRYYSSQLQIIPYKNLIWLPHINDIENPVFSYRSVHSFEAFSDTYSRWHKLVDSDDKKSWGMFVHTFHILLPAEKYFKKHPEYFALRDSLRVPLQLCLTHPEVYKIICSELQKNMEKNPAAKIWSVSQNDNESYCQCATCQRINKREESPSGSLLEFVNKVAQKFPDKTISTLAYQYSRKPPMFIKPVKNVNIMLCSIEALRTYPLEADTSSNSFAKDLMGWSKITNNLFIWDYVVQFTNLVSPFPNFHILQPNIRFFAKYGAPMVFEQGAGRRQGAEFSELRSYLIAKLLWNPEVNVDSLMNDFLFAYYGPAGKYIRSYIKLMTNALLNRNAALWIYDNPVNSMKDYLAADLMDQYNVLFDSAETVAIKQSTEGIQERVRNARLPLTYVMLEQAKVIGEGQHGTFVKNQQGKYTFNHRIKNLLDEFVNGCKQIGNVHINEKQLTAKAYVERYNIMLSKIMKNPLGLFKPVTFKIQPNWKYPANGEKTLSDGRRGDEDYHFNWLGFEGEDMDVIIDLQKAAFVKKVSSDFLQESFSWVFMPEQIEVSLSMDGKQFNNVSAMQNTIGITEQETLSPINAKIKNFYVVFDSVKARYVRFKATNIKTCPRWHPGYPGKAWIFTDEIVIE